MTPAQLARGVASADARLEQARAHSKAIDRLEEAQIKHAADGDVDVMLDRHDEAAELEASNRQRLEALAATDS